MSDLFSESDQDRGPLPARLRPLDWDAFFGHEDLQSRLRGKPLQSMILHGPPGCGKTTLAGILAREAGLPFRSLSAVSSGVKEVRAVIDEGRTRFMNQGQGFVLFLDEIHRFSRSQQDALLEAVESGWIVLIGATTEHPSFEIVGPLLSRARVFKLSPLTETDLEKILDRAIASDMRLKETRIDEDAREAFIQGAVGDARRLLSFIETAANLADSDHIDLELASEILESSRRYFDRRGENHFDYVSAFIKSMRASDPDATLAYLAVMIDGGEDPLFIARRMIIFASEDVGNAAPQAIGIATSAFQALERIGMPEGRIVLAQAATFLASCSKSNAAYLGIDAALNAIKHKRVDVPNFLRNAATNLHKAEGASDGYQYPHDHPGHFSGQDCRPAELKRLVFYRPSDQGQEARIRERLASLWPDRYGEGQSKNE